MFTCKAAQKSVDKFSFIDKNSSVDTRQELGGSSKQCITQIQKTFLEYLLTGFVVWIIPLVVLLKDGIKSLP